MTVKGGVTFESLSSPGYLELVVVEVDLTGEYPWVKNQITYIQVVCTGTYVRGSSLAPYSSGRGTINNYGLLMFCGNPDKTLSHDFTTIHQ